MPQELAHILVGDHLGKVKKILLPSYEISNLPECAEADSKNPVISIEPIGSENKQLIANKNGELRIYDPVRDELTLCSETTRPDLVRALPKSESKIFILHDKEVSLLGGKEFTHIKHKSAIIRDGKEHDGSLAIVGENISCNIYDVQTRKKTFTADNPGKDWLGITPPVHASGVDFVGQSKIATCSKSDSVIRVYDPKAGTSKPVIEANLNQEAFNEHAEAGRHLSIASTGINEHCVIVGSNVGQIRAIDLRFNVKLQKKKKLQPKLWKVLGAFKGTRGGSITDIKVAPSEFEGGDRSGHKVISCCLDRYVRVHDFTDRYRVLNKEVYITTKPTCCTPVFYVS